MNIVAGFDADLIKIIIQTRPQNRPNPITWEGAQPDGNDPEICMCEQSEGNLMQMCSCDHPNAEQIWLLNDPPGVHYELIVWTEP